jgi:uncharacterized membrane protein
MTTLRGLLLLGATITMGLIAGTFALYSHTIMPGLRRTDDRTFVAAFGSVDRAIINPWFMAGAFVGAAVLTALAALTQLDRPARGSVLAALGLYLVAVGVTIVVHVPANDGLKVALSAAGGVDRVHDLAAVRHAFDEARWAGWNLLRTGTSLAAFVSLCWALVLHGRATA